MWSWDKGLELPCYEKENECGWVHEQIGVQEGAANGWEYDVWVGGWLASWLDAWGVCRCVSGEWAGG